jgi:ABC-type multidrug transport system fused ATPase/permease subunit
MLQIVSASTRLTCITAGYGWFTIIAPIVVASPGYFGGDLSFGGLMMVVGAFIQVQQALRWFIDNFSTIADWRATLLRIASFREAVITMDRLGATENRIEFVEAVGGTITFENLEIATPKGCTTLNERHSEHRVFIGGRSSCLPPQRTVLRDKEKLRTPQLPRQEYGGSAWGFAQAFYGGKSCRIPAILCCDFMRGHSGKAGDVNSAPRSRGLSLYAFRG